MKLAALLSAVAALAFAAGCSDGSDDDDDDASDELPDWCPEEGVLSFCFDLCDPIAGVCPASCGPDPTSEEHNACDGFQPTDDAYADYCDCLLRCFVPCVNPCAQQCGEIGVLP
ncbi:MAG: hypothetical protein M5R36_26510 [Deltaproteobacteria bacterium]|nr:hypothetical protein [Deltaproteobacteria bacterium]